MDIVEELASERRPETLDMSKMARWRLRIRQNNEKPVILDDIRVPEDALQSEQDSPATDSCNSRAHKLAKDQNFKNQIRKEQVSKEKDLKDFQTLDFMGVVSTFMIPESFVAAESHNLGNSEARVTTKDTKTSCAISEFLCQCHFEKLQSFDEFSGQEILAISDKAWLTVLLANEPDQEDLFFLFYFSKLFDDQGNENNLKFLVSQLYLAKIPESVQGSREWDVAKDLRRRASSLKDTDNLSTSSEGHRVSRTRSTGSSVQRSKRATLRPIDQMVYRNSSQVSSKTIETMVHAALRLRDGSEAGGYSNVDYAELWGNTVRTVEFIYERYQKKRASRDNGGSSYPEADIDALRGWVERCLELFGE